MSGINGKCMCYTALFALGGIVAVPVAVVAAPIVSLVAIPVFALKALSKCIDHQKLYKQTLTNQTREKYGRIPGQDYTRWDGKEVVKNLSPTVRKHESMGEYFHGLEKNPFQEHAADNPFSTIEDKKWLALEHRRLQVKELMGNDLKMIRKFAKALIPLIGLIWVACTEVNTRRGASQFRCRACVTGDGHQKHWSRGKSISYHINALGQKLREAGVHA